MTQKTNKLAAAFSKTQTESPAAPQNKKVTKASREGKTPAVGYIDPAGMIELKTLAARLRKTQQDLMVEAINDLLIKHGMKPLA
jgi:uncharacterized protein YkwD